MSDSSININGGRLQNFTIDQFAGAMALILGSLGGLLMIIWKSRCACKVRLGLTDYCICFECSRTPPPDDDEDEKNKDTKQSINEVINNKQSNNIRSNKKIIKSKPPLEPEPEIEPQIEKLIPNNQQSNKESINGVINNQQSNNDLI